MKKIICFTLLFVLYSTLSAQIIGPKLKFLSSKYTSENLSLLKLPSKNIMPATLQFKKPVNISEIEQILPDGITLFKVEGRPLYSAHVVVVKMDLSIIVEDDLFLIPNLLQAEALWRPQHIPPLNVSRPQIQAEQLWKEIDNQGRDITGKGIVIADFDTGIDLMHPAFFSPDGDTLDWIDANGNGDFNAGIDGIDKNISGNIDNDELLNFVAAFSATDQDVPPEYYPSLDWLYNDINNNQVRDYGSELFQESDATYGEPLYIVLDKNKNDVLDAGEKLVALNTCKVRKVFQTDGIIRSRGIDLIYNEGDYYGHGTPVCGILAGGVAGVHQYAGIAPDAEILMGTNIYVNDPPFIFTMEIFAPWAANEGANIMLYEDGEWIWQYMDGSSPLETMINDFAAQGIIQVVPAGNLAGGGMHTSGNILGSGSKFESFTVVSNRNQRKVWGDFLWLGDSSGLFFELRDPSGNKITLTGEGNFQTLGNYEIYSYLSRSIRGTNRFDFLIWGKNKTIQSTFSFILKNERQTNINYHAYLWDDKSSWNGNTRWNNANDDGTVTWPATADSAITVAAYNPNTSQQSLNDFSGRGARVDGKRLVDIGAPGSSVRTTARHNKYGGYQSFGGTSSAGPHVAGAIALLMQSNHGITSGEIRSSLNTSADQQNIIGNLPNHEWGYGRLRIFDAFNNYLAPVCFAQQNTPKDFSLSAYPNPFNSTVKIRYSIDKGQDIKISIFNILGKEIIDLGKDFCQPGSYQISWNGRNHYGRVVSSGIYFVHLKTAEEALSHKILLLR
ncbi:S8 family peptidase [candidate division KSB1 bacterium]|nr:S8 family peptidase [candidate division KSB1 bacterium]MBL7093415.1 S8 family peptidase [candidate division KSB1 bacterium]